MATIFDLDSGNTITEGLQGCHTSNEALRTARSIARENNSTVVLDDDDGEWLVGPRGGVRRLTDGLKRRYGFA